MKLKLILLIAIVLTPCGQAVAQGSSALVGTYDREIIYIHYSFFGDGFVKNGQIMSLGVFGSNLAREMAGSEYALDEMMEARKYRIAGTATNLAATAFSITGIVLAFRDSDSDDSTLEIISIVVGGICGLLAEGFDRAAMAKMNRAVWLYNRDVMSGRLRTWRR